MADYHIISDVSSCLLQRLRNAICPELIPHPEQISLNSPCKKDNDALMGIYLYSIRDYSSFVPERSLSLVGSGGYSQSKVISLAYLIYFSNYAQAPLDAVIQQQALGKAIALICAYPTIDIGEIHAPADANDEAAAITFQKLDDHQKHDLWSGFSEAMRPAIYLEVGPLLIRGEKIALSRVTLVEGGVERK